MFRNSILILLCMTFLAPWTAASADELTRIIQEDLTTLGYDTGGADGQMGTKTIIAISKFQAENDLEVTGEATPQLAGVIKAAIQRGGEPQQARARAAAPTERARDPQAEQAALQAAQQKCLQDKIAAAEEAQKKKSGFGKLMRAASRTASTFGSSELSRQVSRTTYEVYSVNATADDLAGAAKDLGLTEDEVEACRNP